MGCIYDLLVYVANFDLGDITVMKLVYCTRLHYICYCSLKRIILIGDISLPGGSEINVIL